MLLPANRKFLPTENIFFVWEAEGRGGPYKALQLGAYAEYRHRDGSQQGYRPGTIIVDHPRGLQMLNDLAPAYTTEGPHASWEVTDGP